MLSIERPINKPIRDLTNDELLSEWHYWNDKIKNAKGWGAALAAANGFRTSCEVQLKIRKIAIPVD